ncbi:unnamed protein product [Plutella xylostella]|uniref:(diamondback moth) hypothetical protein n=1 Tax=Plutella xylostella TaxID=51655 RepID=A0A8S4G9V5_PLUXY|nr:unnamed protein product [Plutella xylostella]
MSKETKESQGTTLLARHGVAIWEVGGHWDNEPLAENLSPPPEEQSPVVTIDAPPEPTNTDTLTQVDESEEIDVEFLSALGDTTPETPMYGEKIHETLAQRWLPILRRGLPKEAAESLLKEYRIPENCKLLRAPTLNPEIISAINGAARGRDKKIENLQQQLGLGITAINRAMNTLVTGSGDDKQDKVQAVKVLSDACRILSDLHYKESESRSNLILPGLDKSFLSVIQDVERDESLFGSKLGDKIRASQMIEKQGLQIKKVVTIQKPPAPSTSKSANGSRYQGNWSTPSRFQPSSSNRGGEGRRAEDPSDAEANVSVTGNDTSEGQLQQAACSSTPLNLIYDNMEMLKVVEHPHAKGGSSNQAGWCGLAGSCPTVSVGDFYILQSR